MRVFEKTVFMLIFLLFIPFVHALNCVDHDDGLNYYQKSNVTFYGEDYPDRCVDSKILIEGYCNEDNLVLTSYDCSPSSCENGKCTQITTTTTTTSTTTSTIEECALTNINIDTSHCRGIEGTCCAGDSIDVTVHYSGNCPSTAYLQLDLGDNDLTYDGSGCEVYDDFPLIPESECNGLADMDGLGYIVTCSGGSCTGSTQLQSGTYAISASDCKGVTINMGWTGLYKNGFPCEADNPVSINAWTNLIYGSITFGTDSQCGFSTTTTTTSTVTTTPGEVSGGNEGTTTTTKVMTAITTSTNIITTTTKTTTTTQTTTTITTSTTFTTTTTNPIIFNIEGIISSCEGSPSHSCSEKKDSYPGFPDIEEMDFDIPDSANCEDTIEVTVKWTGWHGYRDDNINECTPNYWAVFIETSPGIYSLLDSCQSFNESDCELFDPNTYIMNFDVKMPNKDSVVDGTYNIYVTGETDSGYCDPGESNADIELSKPINLMNCGDVSQSTTTTSIVTTASGEGGGLGTTTTTSATTQTTTTPEEITTPPSETTTTQLESTTTIKSGTGGGGGGGGGHILMQDLTKIIPIAVVIALVVLVIIFGIMKFTKSKNVEPKPQYNEESSEKPFY